MHLHHRVQRPGSDSLAHSSGLGDKAGSCPGSGSVGLGCSSPEGRGTVWRIWCLKSKVQRRESRWPKAGEGGPAACCSWTNLAGPVVANFWPESQELLPHQLLILGFPGWVFPGPGSTKP